MEEVLDLMTQQVEKFVLVVRAHLSRVKSMSQLRFF